MPRKNKSRLRRLRLKPQLMLRSKELLTRKMRKRELLKKRKMMKEMHSKKRKQKPRIRLQLKEDRETRKLLLKERETIFKNLNLVELHKHLMNRREMRKLSKLLITKFTDTIRSKRKKSQKLPLGKT